MFGLERRKKTSLQTEMVKYKKKVHVLNNRLDNLEIKAKNIKLLVDNER